MSFEKRMIMGVILSILLSLSIVAAISPFEWIKQVFGGGITGFVTGSGGSGYNAPKVSGSSGADSSGNVEVVRVIGSGSGGIAVSGSGSRGEVSIVSGGELTFAARSSKVIALGGGQNYKITLLSVGENNALFGVTLPDGRYKLLKGENGKVYEIEGLTVKIKSIVFASTNRGNSRVVVEAHAKGNVPSTSDVINLKVVGVSNSSSGNPEDDEVVFSRVTDGMEYKTTFLREGNGGVIIGGYRYDVNYIGDSAIAEDERIVYFSSQIDGSQIKLKRGGGFSVSKGMIVASAGGEGSGRVKSLCSILNADIKRKAGEVRGKGLVLVEMKRVIKGDFVIVTDGESARLLKLVKIENSSVGYENDMIEFEDAINGDSYKVSVLGEGRGQVYVMGKLFTVYYNGDYESGSAKRFVEIDYPGSTRVERFSFEVCLPQGVIGGSGSTGLGGGGGADVMTLTNEEPERTVTVGGEKYKIRLIAVSDLSATIRVSNLEGKSESREIVEDMIVVLLDKVEIKVVSADESNGKIAAVLQVKKASLAEMPQPVCNNGCYLDTKCVPYGVRSNGNYCDISGSIMKQKRADRSCQNGYECIDNACAAGRCLDVNKLIEENNNLKGMLYKLWCKVNNFFDEEGYNSCLSKYLGWQVREYKYVINEDFGEIEANQDSDFEVIDDLRKIMPDGFVEEESITYRKGDNSDLIGAVVMDYDHIITFEEFKSIKNKLDEEGIESRYKRDFRIEAVRTSNSSGSSASSGESGGGGGGVGGPTQGNILVVRGKKERPDSNIAVAFWASRDKIVFIAVENVIEAGRDGDTLVKAYMGRFPATLEIRESTNETSPAEETKNIRLDVGGAVGDLPRELTSDDLSILSRGKFRNSEYVQNIKVSGRNNFLVDSQGNYVIELSNSKSDSIYEMKITFNKPIDFNSTDSGLKINLFGNEYSIRRGTNSGEVVLNDANGEEALRLAEGLPVRRYGRAVEGTKVKFVYNLESDFINSISIGVSARISDSKLRVGGSFKDPIFRTFRITFDKVDSSGKEFVAIMSLTKENS